MHAVGGHQLKYKYQFSVHLHACVFVHAILMSISCICCYIYGYVCDYYMYSFTVISALICVIAECKLSVKYWYVLLSPPHE
jgi:hypothetical protein